MEVVTKDALIGTVFSRKCGNQLLSNSVSIKNFGSYDVPVDHI